jgi:hypothetical protein
MHETILATPIRALPNRSGQFLHKGHLRLLTQNLQRLATDKGQLLAQFNQRFQFLFFSRLEETLVVAVHQFLNTMIRLRWEMQISNSFYPIDWRGDG